MRAVVLSGFGGVEVLSVGERPDPVPGEDELLVRVRATALNRADLLQRRGRYPPPEGAPDILGLEIAGEVAAAGPLCPGWVPGDRLMALVPGGGYAELASVNHGLAIRLPGNLSFEEGAAIPEAFLTAWRALFDLGQLEPGRTVLVHAAASGVGTAALQLAREAGATILATAGTPGKLRLALALGAQAAWNHREGPFAPWVVDRTGGRGVDLVLDLVGAPYFEQNIRSLAVDGRLIVIGMMGGSTVERLNLGTILFRRLRIIGTSLRALPVEEKADLVRRFETFALPRLGDGRLKPVVDSVYDWTEVAEAHARMESNANAGKIVLGVTPVTHAIAPQGTTGDTSS